MFADAATKTKSRDITQHIYIFRERCHSPLVNLMQDKWSGIARLCRVPEQFSYVRQHCVGVNAIFVRRLARQRHVRENVQELGEKFANFHIHLRHLQISVHKRELF